MKKGISVFLALCILASFFTFAGTLTLFAYDLSVLTKAITPQEISDAQAAKNILTKADTSSSLGNYFGLFYDYYYKQITLPVNQAITEVVAYKDRIDMVKALCETSDLYLAPYYSSGTLQNMWNAARAKVPVSQGLIDRRNAKLDILIPVVADETQTGIHG